MTLPVRLAYMAAMFGLPSLQKLLLLGLIVAAVWYGFKVANRVKESRERQNAQQRGTAARRPARKSKAPDEEAIAAEDMVPCPKCGAYVTAKGSSNCGKPDCPY